MGMIDTQKLRKVAENANEFAGSDVAEWPLTTKKHIRSLALTVSQCADTIDAQTAEIAEAKGQIEHLDRKNNALREALSCIAGTKTHPGDEKAAVLLASVINLAFVALEQEAS